MVRMYRDPLVRGEQVCIAHVLTPTDLAPRVRSGALRLARLTHLDPSLLDSLPWPRSSECTTMLRRSRL